MNAGGIRIEILLKLGDNFDYIRFDKKKLNGNTHCNSMSTAYCAFNCVKC